MLAQTLLICCLLLSKTFLCRWHTSLLFYPRPSWDLFPHQQSLPWLPHCHLKWNLPVLLFLLKFSLTKPKTRWPQSQEILFVFVFLCLWLQVIWWNCLQFHMSPATNWKGRKVKLSFLWTICGDTDILNSEKQEGRDLLKPLPSFLQGALLFLFQGGAELILAVSN